MNSPSGLDRFKVARPNVARIYDALLGGKNNFQRDREAAQDLLEAVPGIGEWARKNRLFLANAVHHLASLGIGQFIDIGSGLPTAQNTHEVARRIRARVRCPIELMSGLVPA